VSLWLKVFNTMHNKLSEREEYIATQIVDIAIKIHKGLGPGLLESVYEIKNALSMNYRSEE